MNIEKTKKVGWGVLLVLTLLCACTPFTKRPTPGPDKQALGTWYGAAIGAGSGAVVGFQLGANTGPGAALGAGFGALFGMFSGLSQDMLEEDQLRRLDEAQRLREISWVNERLTEHYARRLELHPNRDIFPADWFFEGDSIELRPGAGILVEALAEMTRQRMPWSRIVIASYSTASDPSSTYAAFITKKRAEEIANRFVGYGIEPRRVLTQAMTLPEPILIDPDDHVGRYRQAIELIPLDH